MKIKIRVHERVGGSNCAAQDQDQRKLKMFVVPVDTRLQSEVVETLGLQDAEMATTSRSLEPENNASEKPSPQEDLEDDEELGVESGSPKEPLDAK